jgi:tetratricopeptide (TPR) repeat protein
VAGELHSFPGRLTPIDPDAVTRRLGPRRNARPPAPAAPAPPTPAAPPAHLGAVGRYPVVGEIARGGMGAVLRGHDPELGRDLAIKVLLERDEEMVRRFVEEAQIGGQLQHPGIVPVYEIGLYGDDRPYFTMKLVQGRTLAQLLSERAGPGHELPRFLTIFQQVCLTVAYAHERGVVHRDLKPSNVMVGSFGEVQVMDWGVAKVLRRPAEAPRPPSEVHGAVRTIRSRGGAAASVAGVVTGTPSYMAPEQARGEAERVDARADVFALGSILCELLTGHPAYEGGPTEDTYQCAAHADLGPALRRLDHCDAEPQLVGLARKCLAPEPEGRPRDAGVVAAEVTAYLDGVQERLRRAELECAAAQARAAAEKRSRRLTQTLAAVIAATLLGLALAGWWSYERRARLRADVEGDLAEAERWQAEEKWAEARTAAERAGGRLGGAGPEDLQRRQRRLRDDLAMIERLEGIRLAQAAVSGGRFDRAAALTKYPAAFRDFGLDVLALEPDEAARRVRASAIRAQLVAALDDWLLLLHDARDGDAARLLEVVQQADGDGPLAPLRRAWAARDWERLREQAAAQEIAALPPTALFVSAALFHAQAPRQAVAVLEAAQRRHPGDFWLNHQLAYALARQGGRDGEVVGYYQAALALRPDCPGVWVNLSVALSRAGRLDDAVAACERAVELDPNYAEAHTNLAYFYRKRGRAGDAERALRTAQRLKPELAEAHVNLFYVLQEQGRLDEAEAAMREGVRLAPDNAAARHDFGVFLQQRGRTEDAAAEFRRAVELEPDGAAYHTQLAYALDKLGRPGEAEAEYRAALRLDGGLATAHTNLGALLFARRLYAEAEAEHRAATRADPRLAPAHANLGVTLARQGKHAEAEAAFRRAIELTGERPDLLCRLGAAVGEQGRFREGYDLIRRGHERGAAAPGWDLSSEQWLKRFERDAELEGRLTAVLAEATKPKDAAEWLDFARVCQAKKRYADAVTCYQRAFAADANLATDYARGGGRSHAAGAAALAASAEETDEAARGRLRQQALAWLRADVAGWGRSLERPATCEKARASLELIQRDPSLAGVRDEAALAKLPEAERAAFRQLWANVADLLKHAAEPRP